MKKARHLAVTGLRCGLRGRAGLPRRPSGRGSPGSYQAVAGLLASINARTSEVANNRWRSLSMVLMVLGYPLGSVVVGLAISPFMATGS